MQGKLKYNVYFCTLLHYILDTAKIAFIINPGSGNVLKRGAKSRIIEYLKVNTSYPIFLTKTAEDSNKMVRQLVSENYDAIFACGGDGTMNAVSKELLHTNTALGVIPMGSGNGFARHFNIPLNWKKAIKLAENHKEICIDTADISGRHFLNVAGLGYSAHVSKAFKRNHGRGIMGYVKVILQNLFMDNRNVHFKSAEEEIKFQSWTVEFFNGSQWGADAIPAAKAKADDGKLDLVAFKKLPFVMLPIVALRVMTRSSQTMSQIQRARFTNADIEFDGIWGLQTDGDYIGKVKGKVEVRVKPSSLKVWVPA